MYYKICVRASEEKYVEWYVEVRNETIPVVRRRTRLGEALDFEGCAEANVQCTVLNERGRVLWEKMQDDLGWY